MLAILKVSYILTETERCRILYFVILRGVDMPSIWMRITKKYKKYIIMFACVAPIPKSYTRKSGTSKKCLFLYPISRNIENLKSITLYPFCFIGYRFFFPLCHLLTLYIIIYSLRGPYNLM